MFVVLGFSIFLDRDRTDGRGAGWRERSKESKRQTNGWVARASDTYRAHDGHKGGMALRLCDTTPAARGRQAAGSHNLGSAFFIIPVQKTVQGQGGRPLMLVCLSFSITHHRVDSITGIATSLPHRSQCQPRNYGRKRAEAGIPSETNQVTVTFKLHNVLRLKTRPLPKTREMKSYRRMSDMTMIE